MCGIAGAIEHNVRSAESLHRNVLAMISPLIHRGPDDGGIWSDTESGVAIGHRRLSIRDLSAAGAQPMISASGCYVLSYNGEIYNALELRAELEAGGTIFRGKSDTEVLLEACATWGVERTAKRLIGMFAFALWSRSDRHLWLVRDRIGIKPLYYSATSKFFTFASELSGLKSHPDFDCAINHDAVEAFLVLDYIPAPLSIFRNAHKLEPGTILQVNAENPSQVTIKPYWTLAEAARKGTAEPFTGSFEEAMDDLELLLTDAVGRRMISDVPLGAFLSGGIDSSAVVALMQNNSTLPVKTFSIGFEQATHNEAPYAKAVAEFLGTDHVELYISDDVIRELGPAVLGHQDEPIADPSMFPTWLVSHLAKRDVTVALSGDGGDEIFGGYGRHLQAERCFSHAVWQLKPMSRFLFRSLIPYLPRISRNRVQKLFFANGESKQSLSPKELKQLALGLRNPHWIHHFLAHGDVQISYGRSIGPEHVIALVNRWLMQSEHLSAAERQQYIDCAGYLPDNILTKVDRASMAVSLEARVPLLDHRIVEFSFRLPATMKTDDLYTKRILRKILSRHAPEPLFDRPKQGFSAPTKYWMGGPLKDWAVETASSNTDLLRIVSQSYISAKALTRIQAGRARQTDYRKIILSAWLKNNS